MIQAYPLDFEQKEKELERRYWQTLDMHLEFFSRQELTLTDDATFQNLTDISLAVHELLRQAPDTAVAMTHLFRITYLSNQLHLRIKDKDEGQLYDRKLKHAVLIGDYLFGQAFELLLQQGAQNLIGIYTRMLTEINAGLVMKYRLEAPQEEVLHKTKANIYGTIFYTAAKLAQKPSDWKKTFADLGHQTGMALELAQLKDERAHFYRQRSQEIWESLALEQDEGAKAWKEWWKSLLLLMEVARENLDEPEIYNKQEVKTDGL